MRELRRIGNQITVSLPMDDEGMIGRECPQPECQRYFKFQPGTGREEENKSTTCPYCGHRNAADNFHTKAQLEYAESVLLKKVTDAAVKDLEASFSGMGLGKGSDLSISVKGDPIPLRHYREKRLETPVICNACSLHFKIYGKFAFCPDCGVHNSLQILNANLDLVGRLLDLSRSEEAEMKVNLVEQALQACVSAFDGFGRETCRAFSSNAQSPTKAKAIRFQNIKGARERVSQEFGVDFAEELPEDAWTQVIDAFEKRHLLAHKMGVMDEDYLKKTRHPASLRGRKVVVSMDEIERLRNYLSQFGERLIILIGSKA